MSEKNNEGVPAPELSESDLEQVAGGMAQMNMQFAKGAPSKIEGAAGPLKMEEESKE